MGNAKSILSAGIDQGFNIPQAPLTEKNIPDQTGKVFIITGANAGVGQEVTSILYSVNATVYLACRTESKAQAAIKSITAAHPNSHGSLHFLHLDLADLSSIKSTANDFLSRETKLHWLDNNAGVMVPPRGSKAKQGHELQFCTNVLGPYLLTKLLLPVLKATAEAEAGNTQGDGGPGSVRVSWAGSFGVDIGSPTGGVMFKQSSSSADGALTIEDFNGGDKAYGSTKAANFFLANEFGRRYGDRDGVLHNAYNPGNLSTNLQDHAKAAIPIIAPLVIKILAALMLYPAVQGAYTELYAGFSRDMTLEKDQGGYVIPWGRKATWMREDVKANVGEGKNSEKLWEWCEQETKAYA